MKYITPFVLFFAVTIAHGQERANQTNPPQSSPAKQTPEVQIPNPFKARSGDGMSMDSMMGADMGAEMGVEMGAMGGGEDMMAMGMGGMGMGGMGMGGVDHFQRGLQRAIQMLGDAKTESQRTVLQGYIREALESRYEEIIAKRRKDLERLKRSVAQLEDELNRRESAKDRVVGVQMQSVQLAAEGLLNLSDLQNVAEPPGAPSGGFGGFGRFGN